MDPFSYLSVLISIVLGLGITQLLGGFATLVRDRARIRMYWPLPVQMGVLFLIHVQLWWALFSLRTHVIWQFSGFLVVLMQPVILFLVTAVITPESPRDESIDLRARYFRESRWFFAGLLASVALSLLKSVIVAGSWPKPADLVGHGLFAAIALTGLSTRNDLTHRIIAPLSLALYGAYIAVLFLDLPS